MEKLGHRDTSAIEEIVLIDARSVVRSHSLVLLPTKSIPLALKLRSPKELELVNEKLMQEMNSRMKIEDRLRKNEEVLKKNQTALTAKNIELNTTS